MRVDLSRWLMGRGHCLASDLNRGSIQRPNGEMASSTTARLVRPSAHRTGPKYSCGSAMPSPCAR